MSKKNSINKIPDEDIIKTILEGVDSDSESTDAFEVPEDIEFPKMEDSFSPVGLTASADENTSATLPGNPPAAPQTQDSTNEDRTVAVNEDESFPEISSLPETIEPTDAERTIAVTAFAKRKKATTSVSEEKVVVGMVRPMVKGGLVHTSIDASLAQAENLKVAQQRIMDLEKELDHLRSENEELASVGQILRQKSEDLNVRMLAADKEKRDAEESLENEIFILKENLKFKDAENQKSKQKIEELDIRLKNDFKKIRVRERELENRLELARAEKQALVRSKDDTILELQRKIDQMKSEIDTYREKVQELNKSVEAYQDQMKRTVRALRLALTNLEVRDESFPVLKKAE